ncbi:clumping factor B [Mobilicoccus caccae]|uniref:Clumping factor B n=1 Tax=Mobilicoccus caccae TaxID=1859295 RepID=A0ABQ6IK50_9MICO|nr:clumping factor B [Mobilicoccus caccae]
MQQSDEFKDLRKRFRGFVFPCTIFFLTWYFAYVILAAYFPEFMSTRVFGLVNIGLIFGLLQFVTTFGITIAYVRWADKVFDPRADAIRERFMGDQR